MELNLETQVQIYDVTHYKILDKKSMCEQKSCYYVERESMLNGQTLEEFEALSPLYHPLDDWNPRAHLEMHSKKFKKYANYLPDSLARHTHDSHSKVLARQLQIFIEKEMNAQTTTYYFVVTDMETTFDSSSEKKILKESAFGLHYVENPRDYEVKYYPLVKAFADMKMFYLHTDKYNTLSIENIWWEVLKSPPHEYFTVAHSALRAILENSERRPEQLLKKRK